MSKLIPVKILVFSTQFWREDFSFLNIHISFKLFHRLCWILLAAGFDVVKVRFCQNLELREFFFQLLLLLLCCCWCCSCCLCMSCLAKTFLYRQIEPREGERGEGNLNCLFSRSSSLGQLDLNDEREEVSISSTLNVRIFCTNVVFWQVFLVTCT